ncbi:MAG: hypothetical protein KY453_06255 [Gemmatimonadetes bacterium]|nr:hypothetical protein [Gemmatimonadota bacterium]
MSAPPEEKVGACPLYATGGHARVVPGFGLHERFDAVLMIRVLEQLRDSVAAHVLPSIPRPLDRAAARLAGRGGGSTGRKAPSEAPAEDSGHADEEGGAPEDRTEAAGRPQEAGAPLLGPLSVAGRLTATARAPEAS